jgi:RNase P subunit RPR2
MVEAKAGEWYFVTACKHCRKPVLTFADPSKGKLKDFFRGPGWYQTTCPHCGKAFRYQGSEVSSHEIGKAT